MTTTKMKMAEIVQEQPEDATYEEIMRELAFNRMIERGLTDSNTAKITWTHEAERWLNDIFDYIAQDNPSILCHKS